MEKLAANLLEELNCENVFTIPVFGGIGVSESTVVTWVIMAVLTLLAWLMTRNLKVDHISGRPQSRALCSGSMVLSRG